MFIGVDNGNSNTKSKNFVFPSGVISSDLKPAVGEDIIEFNNKFYTLTTERMTYQHDKTQDEKCFVLSLFAIAKEILERDQYQVENDIYLGVGLPPEHYSLLKNKFRDYFRSFGKKVSFLYNEKMFHINILGVKVYPQCFAAGTLKQKMFKEYSQIYIVDIGGYTTDILLISNNAPDLSFCISLEKGMILMCNAIKSKVSGLHETRLSDQQIMDVVSGRGKKVVFGEDIKKTIRDTASEYFNEILKEIRERGADLTATPAIFVGGGSIVFKDQILTNKKIALAEVVDNIHANALGYELFIEHEHSSK